MIDKHSRAYDLNKTSAFFIFTTIKTCTANPMIMGIRKIVIHDLWALEFDHEPNNGVWLAFGERGKLEDENGWAGERELAL